MLNEDEVKHIEVNDAGKGTDSVQIKPRTEVKESGVAADTVLVLSPRRVITDALRDKDWFKGIVLSATYFEHFGLVKLKTHFKEKISEKKLNRLSLASIITLLFGCELIDQNTYTRMIEVKERRDDFVHQPYANVIITENEGEIVLKKALQCLERLLDSSDKTL